MERKIKARFVSSLRTCAHFIKLHILFFNPMEHLLLIATGKRIFLWRVLVALYNDDRRRPDYHYLALIFL